MHIEFPTIDDFKHGFEKHGEELSADVPNYTNIAPDMQISEIVKARECPLVAETSPWAAKLLSDCY